MSEEVRQKIPARLESAVKGGYVAGAKDIVDDTLGKAQSVVNEEHEEAISDLQESVGTGGSVDERIAAEKNRAEAAETALANGIEGLTQSEVVVGELPASGEASKIYRVPGETSYTDYAWNGSQFVPLAEYDNGIDDEPIAGSGNLVKSGGVYDKAVLGKILNKVAEADFIIGKTIKAADGSFVIESYSTNTSITTYTITENDLLYGRFHCNGSANDLAVAFYNGDSFINSGNNIKGNDYTSARHWSSINPPVGATKICIATNNREHALLFKISYVDKELDIHSNLPIANKVIAQALANLSVDGYLYQGIATASTNPGTPTVKVFYFAQNAGTYTNFNGLVVNRGLAILKYNNGWALDQLYSTSDYITDSSDLLPASVVKTNSIVIEKESVGVEFGKYLKVDGSYDSGASSSRSNYYFDIIAGKSYIVYGFTESNPTYAVFACYDSNGIFVPLFPDTSKRGTSLQRTYLTFVAPSNAVSCVVHSNNFVARLWECNNTFIDSKPVSNSQKLLFSGSVYGVYAGSTKEIDYVSTVKEKLINSQGDVVAGSGFVNTYQVTSKTRLLVYCVRIQDSTYLNVAFYNGDIFISGMLSPFLTTDGGKYFSVIVPDNCDTVKIWGNNTYPPRCYETVLITDSVLLNDGRVISSDGVAKAINPLDIRIGNLESIMNVPNEVSVKKDGTGDYSTLRAAIDYAKEHTPITIKIYPGTYNLSDEYTAEEINAASLDGFCGWDIWNGINLKGMSNNRADVVLHAEVSLEDTPSLARQAISTLNLRGNNRIENLTITSRNIRYPIHDDFDTNLSKVHEIINCYIESFFPYYWGGAWHGIGYGAQKFKKLYVEGCEVYPSIMCHNGNQAGGSEIIIKDTKTKLLALNAYADMDMDRYQLYNVSYNRLLLSGANVNSFNIVSTHNSRGVIDCRIQDNYVTEEVQKFSMAIITANVGQAAYVDTNFNLASTGTFYGIHIADTSNGNALVQTCGIISENKLGGIDTTTWAIGDELSVGSNGKLEKSSTAPVAKVKYVIDSVKYIELL